MSDRDQNKQLPSVYVVEMKKLESKKKQKTKRAVIGLTRRETILTHWLSTRYITAGYVKAFTAKESEQIYIRPARREWYVNGNLVNNPNTVNVPISSLVKRSERKSE